MRIVVNADNSVTGLFSDLEIKAVGDAANKVVAQSKEAGNQLVAPLGKRALTEEEMYNSAVLNISKILIEQLADECYFVPEVEG